MWECEGGDPRSTLTGFGANVFTWKHSLQESYTTQRQTFTKIIFTLYGENQFTDNSVNSVDDIPRRCFWQTFISIYLVTYINRNFVDDAACVFMSKKKKKKNTGREEGNSGERGWKQLFRYLFRCLAHSSNTKMSSFNIHCPRPFYVPGSVPSTVGHTKAESRHRPWPLGAFSFLK